MTRKRKVGTEIVQTETTANIPSKALEDAKATIDALVAKHPTLGMAVIMSDGDATTSGLVGFYDDHEMLHMVEELFNHAVETIEHRNPLAMAMYALERKLRAEQNEEG